MSDNHPSIGRRDFLAMTLAAAAGGSLIPRLIAQRADPLQLIVLNPRPLDAETPLAAMTRWQTPNELFFVRSHFGPPTAATAAWTLRVDGEVRQPLSLSLDDLRRMPSVTRPATLECAGNGRGRFALPNTSGIQWLYGAVSNAEWRGVPVSAVLERAGLSPAAAHVWTEAADQGPLSVPKFHRSIPREVALGEALLAYEMNGEALPALHGGPLRLIVPGWFGMASTKWLTHLHARHEVSDTQFMARGYRYGDGSAVQEMRVKSQIAQPLDGAAVSVGRIPVAGMAWTGTGRVQRVDVSADGGASWRPARLTGPDHAGAWRSWEYDLRIVRPGPVTLQARATDTTGATQPVRAAANPAGYGNNSIHEVRIHAS